MQGYDVMYTVSICLFHSFFDRYFPVYDSLHFARSSGFPSKTTYPPSSPPSGPRSITQSEHFILPDYVQ